jgi:hypothetical protein
MEEFEKLVAESFQSDLLPAEAATSAGNAPAADAQDMPEPGTAAGNSTEPQVETPAAHHQE